MKNEKFILWLFAFLVFGIWIGTEFKTVDEKSDTKLEEFFRYLDEEYVDTLNTDALVEDAMAYILERLDPHSAYIPEESGELMEQRMQGNFQGIGVEFKIHHDSLVFVHILPNSPAESYGLLAGDRIYAIDGDTIVGAALTNEVVTQKIKGPAKSYVTLSVRRGNLDLTAAVQRGLIPIESVTTRFVKRGVGYVRIGRFAETTHEELRAALSELDTSGMRAVLLDLRDNPGGFLHEAVAIADEFLAENQVIVSTHYRDGNVHTSLATSSGDYEDLPVYILLNENSASASEVLAGALQDHDRATVFGRPSFGKGLVQEDKRMGDGSKVRLTVAYYFTPSGRCIQKEFDGEGFMNFGDSTVFRTDSGRVLVSGGGIIPDVEIDPDSSAVSLWGFSLGTIDAYAFERIDSNRANYQLVGLQEFLSTEISDLVVLDFLKYGGYGLALEDLSANDERQLKNYIRAALARNLWGFDAYERALLQVDAELNNVLMLVSGKLE